MAITMGAQEVANTLRPHLALQHLDPHYLHQLNFLKDVAARLGLDHTPEVLTHIAGLMREHGLVIHSGQEYPKMVARKADGKSFEAKDEEDEDRIVNEVPEELREPPEPTKLDLPIGQANADDAVEDNKPTHDQPDDTDHFGEQEPGAAAMRQQGAAGRGIINPDIAKPTVDLSRRPK